MIHTTEPWISGPNGLNIIDPKTGFVIALTHGNNLKRRDDIRRIVACVNACVGIGTEQLEKYGSHAIVTGNTLVLGDNLKNAEKQLDELLKSSSRAIEAWDATVLPVSNDGMMQERMETLRSAIANAKCSAA
jgi:hypothetical protein